MSDPVGMEFVLVLERLDGGRADFRMAPEYGYTNGPTFSLGESDWISADRPSEIRVAMIDHRRARTTEKGSL